MNHKANWKEIEEAWVELANCVCKSKLGIPCLHCDSDSFKVWYQMKFGKAAFSYGYKITSNWFYGPIEGVVAIYEDTCDLPWYLDYLPGNGWSYARDAPCFKTVKELVMHWRVVF